MFTIELSGSLGSLAELRKTFSGTPLKNFRPQKLFFHPTLFCIGPLFKFWKEGTEMKTRNTVTSISSTFSEIKQRIVNQLGKLDSLYTRNQEARREVPKITIISFE